MRDERVVLWTLARALNPCQGGSAPRTPNAVGKVQDLRNFSILNFRKEKTNLSKKNNLVYVGRETPTLRLENGKEKEKKKDKSDLDEKQKKKLEK